MADPRTAPVCGPCSISNRDCIYADGSAPVSLPHAKPATKPENTASKPHAVAVAGPPLGAGGPDGPHKPPPPSSCPDGGSSTSQHDITPSPHSLYTPTDEVPPPPPTTAALAVGGEPYYGWSPETTASELLPPDLASTRWLDLLATDAAQADGGFSLAASPVPSQSAGSAASYGGMHRPPRPGSQTTSPVEDAAAHERHAWQAPSDIVLQGNETLMFRNFAERAALWVSD